MMQLRITDQIHISSVSPNSLGAGALIEVSEALGQELLKKHPDKVAALDGKSESAPANKAEPKPANKAEQKPANKDAGGKRHSSKK